MERHTGNDAFSLLPDDMSGVAPQSNSLENVELAQDSNQGLTGGVAALVAARASGLSYSLAGELRNTFRSFRHVNYRLYFFGQLVSLSGTFMQSLAQSWLVYEMTKSAWMLGVVNFAGLAPVLVFGLAGGMFADRFDRRRILLAMQCLGMLQAILLAALTLSGRLEIWHVIVLASVLGVVSAFEMPARQAFIVSMVDKEDLVNAMSLNASVFHASRTLGPALAGFLVGWLGEGACFALNAVSYCAALIAIFLIRLPVLETAKAAHKKAVNVADALKFAATTPHLRNILLLATCASLFGMQYLVMMPVVASQVLNMQAGALGALLAGAGVGALLAALFLASRATGEKLKRHVGYASLGFSLSLAIFAMSHDFYLSLALTVPLGFLLTTQLSGSHSLLQLAVSDELRGRVSSIWMMNMLGLLPIGSLIVGCVTSFVGAPSAMLGCAFVCALSAVAYLSVTR